MKRILGRLALLCTVLGLACALLVGTALAENTLTLPADLTTIEAEAFEGLQSVDRIDLPGSVTVIGAGAFRNCGKPTAEPRYYFPPVGVSVGAGAFDGCRVTVKLDGVELPRLTYSVGNDGVTITGSSGSLTEAVIPDTLEGRPVIAIGNNAFNGRSAMTRVVIPATVTSIGQNAFRGCSALTAVDLPTGLASLGANAFRDCSSLTQITLPAGITALPASVFQGAHRLAQVNLQGALTSIGDSAFNDCYALAFDIPATVTQIGEYAFRYNQAMTQATIPSGVTALEKGVFTHCDHLQSVQLPQGLQSIGQAAFDYCIALTGIDLPAGLTSLGTQVFYDCRALTSVSLPAGITALPSETFYNCYALTQVDLPAGLTSVGSNVFYDCQSLSTVSLPASVTALPNDAFRNANALTNIDLPTGLTTLGTGVFKDCRALTEISLPAGVTALPNDTFYNCYALETIGLPEGLTTLGTDVFYYCKALTAINLPEGVTALPSETFYGCYALAGIDLTGITSLGNSVFRECRALTEVTIPEGVTVLPNSLFEEATGLQRVHLPGTLTTINKFAFYHCRALTAVTIPAGVTEIPQGCFQGCSALQQVQLPAGVESIGQNALRECTMLTRINFPSGLTSIGQEAFRDACVGQTANAIYMLPDSVETFGSYAFYNCGAGLLVEKNSDREAFVRTNGYTFAYDADDGFRYQYRKVDNVDTLYLTGYMGAGGNVAIPAGPAIIGESAFADNAAITAVTIPNTVTTLDRNAFRYCTNLASVAMADSVTDIGISTFAYCAKLTDVTFSANLTAIGADAFDYACTSAGTHFYNLPDHIATLGWTPFTDCGAVPCFNRGSDTAALFRSNNNTSSILYTYTGETDFRYRWYNGEGTEGHQERLMQYTGSAATVNIPAYIWLIDANAFKDNTTINKVVIPEGVTHIYANAFRDCANLADITLPDTLTNVEDNAFYGCGSAAAADFTLELPADIDVVRPGSFTSERMILICGLNTTTAERLSNRGYAFVRADRPTELDIRYRWDYFDHVWNWGLYDYAGLLSSVLLPDDCRHVNSERFLQKPDLELKCNQLSDTALGLSEVGLNFTFPGHEGLRYRIIDGVLNLTGCAGTPTQLIVPRANAYIDAGWEEHVNSHSFEDMTTLTKLVLPEGMVKIKDSAFKGCLNLTDVTFPDSLKELENHALEQCGRNADSLHYYALPDNMTGISTNVDAGWGAFNDINMGRISCAPDTTTALQLSGIDTYNHGGSYLFALKGHETDGLMYQYRQYTVNGEPVNRLELRRYEGSGAIVNIPSGTGLYRIENRVFENHQELQRVTLPDGLVEIGEYAFNGCTLLHGGAEEFVIRVPGTVKRIQNNAFYEVGNGYAAERFYLVLPGALDEFDISAVTQCNAVLVAPGGLAAQVLYDNWYYYYVTLEDAKAGTNCQYRREYDAQGLEIPHAHNGRR